MVACLNNRNMLSWINPIAKMAPKITILIIIWCIPADDFYDESFSIVLVLKIEIVVGLGAVGCYIEM